MGSKRYMGAILRLLVSLVGVSLCCLCLAPVARADWGTIYCETSADSIDVASAKAAIAEYVGCITFEKPGNCVSGCCQSNAFRSQCTTLWTWNSRNFNVCGSLRCDDCMWVTQEWLKIIDRCTQNYDGVDRATTGRLYGGTSTTSEFTLGVFNFQGFRSATEHLLHILLLLPKTFTSDGSHNRLRS